MHRFTSSSCGFGPAREANDGRRTTLSRSSATPGFQARNRRPDWVRLTGVVFILFPSPFPVTDIGLAAAKTIAPMRPKLNYCADVRSAHPFCPDRQRHCHKMRHPSCRHGARLAVRRSLRSCGGAPHPVVIFGRGIGFFDRKWNQRKTTSGRQRRIRGAGCHGHPLHRRGSCGRSDILRRTDCCLPCSGDPAGGALA